MDLIRVFSEASPTLMKGLATTLQVTCLSLVLALVIGGFRMPVRHIENETAAVDCENLYLAYPGNTDAGSSILHLLRFAGSAENDTGNRCQNRCIYGQPHYSDIKRRRLYVGDLPGRHRIRQQGTDGSRPQSRAVIQ